MSTPRFTTPERWVEEQRGFPHTLHQWKYLLRQRDQNGLSVAVRKIGKSIVINEDRLAEWLDKHQEDAEAQEHR